MSCFRTAGAILVVVLLGLAAMPSHANAACKACILNPAAGYCVVDGGCYQGGFDGATQTGAPAECRQKNTGAWIYGRSAFANVCPSCTERGNKTVNGQSEGLCQSNCDDEYSGICGWCPEDNKCYPGTLKGALPSIANSTCRAAADGTASSSWQPKTIVCEVVGINSVAIAASGALFGFALLFLIVYSSINARNNAT